MLTRLGGSGRNPAGTEKLSPTAQPGAGYGSWPMISERTSANGCLNARSTFSPAGRYRRPAAISARRNSPIAAIRSATGSSTSAQPASMMLRNGSAMDSTVSAATDKTGTERAGCHAPVRLTAPCSPGALVADGGEAAAFAGAPDALGSYELSLMYPFA